MSPEEIAALFTRADGTYLCARWGRPIVPVVFGVEEATLSVLKGALEAVVALAGHRMAETDPELGANLMLFFFREWDELPQVPNLDRMIPDLAPLCRRLQAEGANQYRSFRHDEAGAIRAAFVFLRMDAHLAELAADDLALTQAVRVMLSWAPEAFAAIAPVVRGAAGSFVRPELAAVLRAAYDPVLPAVAREGAHAFRLAARVNL